MLDQAHDIRPGEELDRPALENYLQEQLPGFNHLEEVRQFPGGFSNLTYLLRTNAGDFVLRRPPFGANIKSAHDMGREHRVLSLLQPVYDRIPRPVLHCEDEAVIGAPFYLMERVEGIILRSRPPQGMDLTPELMHRLSEAAVDNLIVLHNLDIESSGLIQLGKPEGYVERQVSGWIRRYQKAETDEIPAMNDLAKWMQAHRPPDGPPGLIHNDYKYDNLVLDPADPTRIRAVLDWEMATVGDPLMDLGTSLAYWVEADEIKKAKLPVSNLTWLPGNLDRQGVVDRYAQAGGRKVDDVLFYFVYGAFKVAVIVQQIYARYKKGHTQDPRFAALIEAVKYFGRLGHTALEKDRISGLF